MTAMDDRRVRLDRARMLKMARSAHAYVRGNTSLFYHWLAESSAARELPDGPSIWICGDCHLGNLGPLSNGRGGIEVQIRDLDQTVIGNPALDLIRLGLSLASAARGSDLPGVTTARMIEQMTIGYARALADASADIGAAGPEPEAIRTVRRRALGRKWRHLARERIADVAPGIPLGKRFWPLEDAERVALSAVMEDPAIAEIVLSLRPHDPGGDARDRPVKTRLVDAAFWMKGCSSLGLLRYAALVEIDGSTERERYALVDLKEAVAPAAPIMAGVGRAVMPDDPAVRVVSGARALSPHLGERMYASRIGDHAMVVRELMPQDLKIEIDQFSRGEAVKAAHYLAWVVGHAHARQMDPADRRRWRTELTGAGDGIDAPSWLWRSVVDLAAAHEAAYLEHCRSVALDKAA